MDLKELFQETYAKINKLSPDADSQTIESTAKRLTAQNYTPTLLNSINDFSRLTKKTLLAEIKKLETAPAESLAGEPVKEDELLKLRLDQINLILSQFQLLSRLRKDEPEAWDIINELMDDD